MISANLRSQTAVGQRCVQPCPTRRGHHGHHGHPFEDVATVTGGGKSRGHAAWRTIVRQRSAGVAKLRTGVATIHGQRSFCYRGQASATAIWQLRMVTWPRHQSSGACCKRRFGGTGGCPHLSRHSAATAEAWREGGAVRVGGSDLVADSVRRTFRPSAQPTFRWLAIRCDDRGTSDVKPAVKVLRQNLRA